MLNYVPYNKEEAMQFLKDELGWQYYGGKHYESRYTGFVQSYIMPVKFNMDYRRATYSTQICTGEITRDFALNDLKRKSYNEETLVKEMLFLCKKFGLTMDEFSEIMADTPKIYRDYPNNEKRLNFIYNLYRKLTGSINYKGDDY